MKIYISTDMEGIAGVWQPEQCRKGTPEFAEARRWLTAEVRAAVEGAREAGADEFIAADMHNGSGIFVLDELPAGVKVLEGVPHAPRFPFLDDSVAAMFCIGYHAMSGTRAAVLEHTMSGAWQRFMANGCEMGELGIDAALAGCVGVPVALVSGDDKLCAEAKALLGDVESAQVKQGIERHRCLSLTPQDAQALIRDKARAAVARIGQFKPFDIGSPVVVELRYSRASDADMADNEGGQRVDGQTVRWRRATIADQFGGLWGP
jgi:D-amino peptidase